MRMRLAVRGDEAVDTELTVVRLVTEITAVGEIAVTLQTLIHPVPDGCTNDAGVCIDHIPVLLQIAAGITHGVGILAHHKGLVADFLSLTTQVIGIEITVVPDTTIAAVAVVEGWASGIQFANLIIHGLDVRPYAALVA